jgi:hypothetical protein
MTRFVRIISVLLTCIAVLRADPIKLVGANGQTADFLGIWEAAPEGLTVLLTPDGALQLVPWEKFDLVRLKADQPAISTARDKAIFLRQPQPLNLGLFVGIYTVAQLGTEMRRVLDLPATLKVPAVYKTKTETTTDVGVLNSPALNGIIVTPSQNNVNLLNQRTVTETETRQVSPDTITTSLRRVLELMTKSDGVLQSDRRAIFDLCKTNPALIDDAAKELERIKTALPPGRFLANDPTLQTLPQRLTEAILALRSVPNGLTVEKSQQDKLKAFLILADHPLLSSSRPPDSPATLRLN